MAFFLELFRILTTVMNTIMFLSPIPAMREIIRAKSTGHTPFVPLTAMVSNAYVWAVYGWLAKDYVALFGTCSFGAVVAVIYVSIYFCYSTERTYVLKWIAIFGCVFLFNTLYAVLGANGLTGQSYDSVRKIVGYIGTVSSIVMYTSPCEKVMQVFRHKSAVFIPIQIVAVGSLNAASWVIYSLLDVDWIVFTPNIVLLVICLLQVALYWVFHPSKHALPIDLEVGVAKDVAGGARCQSAVLSPTRDDNDHSDGAQYVSLRSPLGLLEHV